MYLPPDRAVLKLPAVYQRFDGQYIDGSWRPGKQGDVKVDTDPYSGATLAETVLANQRDLDQAYHAAAKAQVSWADRLPAERAAVMLRSASIMGASRRDRRQLAVAVDIAVVLHHSIDDRGAALRT